MAGIPRWYKPEVGVIFAEAAFEQAQRADEAGFDWIATSEHHYMPVLQTPNPMIFAGALTRVVSAQKSPFWVPWFR